MSQIKYCWASLFAGLFLSFNASAAGECLGYAGSIIGTIDFKPYTQCPSIHYVIPEGDLKCEVVRTGDFICIPGSLSVKTSGGPWRYSGAPWEERPPGDGSGALPPLDPVSPIEWQDPTIVGGDVAQMNGNLSRLSESFKKLSESINKTFSESASNQSNIAYRVERTYANTVTSLSVDYQTLDKMDVLQASLNSASNYLEDNDDSNYQSLFDQAERHNSVAVQGVNDIKQQANAIATVGWQVDAVKGTVDTINNVMQDQIQQVLSGQQNSLDVQDQYYSMTAGALIGVQQTLDGLSTGGGSPEDSSNLRAIKYGISDLNTSSNRILNATEDVEDAVSGMRSALSDDLYYTTGQLGEKLDAINSSLRSGQPGGGDDDTATNEKLDGIGEGIDSLVNNMKPGTGKKDGPQLCTGEDCYKGNSWIQPKYEEGMKTVWQKHQEAFNNSSVTTYMQGFVPQISGSVNTTWTYCFDIRGLANLGCHDLSLPDYVLTFIRLVMLISTGFVCRRLIFGG